MVKTKEEKPLKCGMVAIVGRPNTGKSTLLNVILKEKVAIVSKIPQTTRNQIRGIYNDERGQIIFIDTPGIHLGYDRLDRFMSQVSTGTLQEADCVIYLVDANRRIGEEENFVAQQVSKVKTPVILALNKIDLKGGNIPEYIALWEKVKNKPINEIKNFMLLPLSGETKVNIDKLIDLLFEYLPEGVALYPVDIVCDVPKRMVIADIIREKLFVIMKKELPHSIGVVVEKMQPRKGKTMAISALILVERDTHKEIVIGKNGNILKTIGTQARLELEELLESKVFLELRVKVQKNWRDNIASLQELGYQSS